ncbi:MAG TPA: endonuclease/exonuclease/phosphatase family protein [Clostridia bacterium]|nr:endonuclease/exonuclease/phosphatase family protein [Clostridia bacterium]
MIRIKPVACLRHALSLAVLFWCGCAGAQTATTGNQSFRVMSYNIHHAEGVDGKLDLERIAALIKAEKADIVALQEVDKGTQRTARRDFPAEFARLTGMTCVFSNNYAFEGGQYGNAVLTHFPVKHATNTHYKMLRTGEQRGLLQVVLDVHGRELVVMNTHIDHRPDDSERLSNAAEARELFKPYAGKPLIVCGDFNDVPGSRTHQKFAELLLDSWTVAGAGNPFTIPADKPSKRIDYIWISKDTALQPVKLWVPRSHASDHLPVVGEFRFKPGGT